MKKLLVVLVAVLVVLGLVGVVADRVVASAAERTINDRVAASFPGVSSTSTSIVGRPVLTQVARGSLDHVAVSLTDVPTSGGVTLATVDVDLYGVTTSAPRTASTVDARAHVTTAALQAKVGDRYRISTRGDVLVVSPASGLPIEATVRPGVTDGRLTLHLESVSLLGLTIDASRVPQSLVDRVTSLAGSIGALPLGLVATSATVTDGGVDLVAHGSNIALEAA
jgi:hypothetical protein